MRLSRHIVMGSRGTAIADLDAIALIEATPTSHAARAWESLLFGRDSGGPLIDPMATLDASALTSFALAEATERGTRITLHGDVTVEIDGEAWTPPPGRTPAASEVGRDVSIVLCLEQGSLTGQWVTTGVIAAGSVAVGSLERCRSIATEAAAGGPSEGLATGDPVPNAIADVEFGNLIGTAAAPRAVPDVPLPPTVESRQIPSPAGTSDRGASTAPFIDGLRFDPTGVVRTSDGREFGVDAPIVFGRRPPLDPIAGQLPHSVVIDDTMISRHHATMLVADGRLQVVDEGSTNGTTVSVPNLSTERCVPGRPVEVPLGATVDLGGALTVTHHSRATPC